MVEQDSYELVSSPGLVQVYVIGSHDQLGQWNAQSGLKLNYCGEYVWQADCVIPRSDFPIKYPFWTLSP